MLIAAFSDNADAICGIENDSLSGDRNVLAGR